MKANNIPANVTNLLNAAEYVRNETIINGNQAAQLDAMTSKIFELSAILDEIPARIAALVADGKEKAGAMQKRMQARFEAQFTDIVASLRAWLIGFKTNRPGVQIDIDEPETEPTNPDITPTTMNANQNNAPEFPELSHAGQCLDIYLNNTREIYDRYTVPAIERVVKAYKAGEHVSDNAERLTKDIQEITPAISAAADIVRKDDHLTPTAQDIEQVTRNYAAYIVDCAKHEIEK